MNGVQIRSNQFEGSLCQTTQLGPLVGLTSSKKISPLYGDSDLASWKQHLMCSSGRTREGPAVPVLSETCLGPAPNFAIWTPRCVADRHGAVATVDGEVWYRFGGLWS